MLLPDLESVCFSPFILIHFWVWDLSSPTDIAHGTLFERILAASFCLVLFSLLFMRGLA